MLDSIMMLPLTVQTSGKVQDREQRIQRTSKRPVQVRPHQTKADQRAAHQAVEDPLGEDDRVAQVVADVSRESEVRQDDPTLALASGFIVRPMSSKWDAIGRIDRIIEPSPKGDNISYIPFDPSAPATMFLGGFEYRASEHFAVIPNAIVTSYDRNDEGIRPNTDVQLRLTFFLNFE